MNVRPETIELDLQELVFDQAAVYRYWDGVRAERPMPAWSEIEMMELPLAAVPWCSVMDVVPGTDDFLVRFWGTQRVQLHGADYTGMRVSQFKSQTVADKVCGELHEVVRRRAPILFETKLIAAEGDNAEPPLFRMLRLPLGEDGEVSSVLCAPSFLENKPLIYDWLGGEAPVSVLAQSRTPDIAE